jgi:hypothetical protein
VARATADVALTGSSDVTDVSELGLGRFDDEGNSRLATDPIALPFPEHAPGQHPARQAAGPPARGKQPPGKQPPGKQPPGRLTLS